jgi:hypothetical protein
MHAIKSQIHRVETVPLSDDVFLIFRRPGFATSRFGSRRPSNPHMSSGHRFGPGPSPSFGGMVRANNYMMTASGLMGRRMLPPAAARPGSMSTLRAHPASGLLDNAPRSGLVARAPARPATVTSAGAGRVQVKVEPTAGASRSEIFHAYWYGTPVRVWYVCKRQLNFLEFFFH